LPRPRYARAIMHVPPLGRAMPVPRGRLPPELSPGTRRRGVRESAGDQEGRGHRVETRTWRTAVCCGWMNKPRQPCTRSSGSGWGELVPAIAGWPRRSQWRANPGWSGCREAWGDGHVACGRARSDRRVVSRSERWVLSSVDVRVDLVPPVGEHPPNVLTRVAGICCRGRS
jgi:hypothetical protein